MTQPGVMPDQRTATVTLQANVDPYGQQVNAATQQTNALANALDKVEQKLSDITKSAGRKLINVGAADVASMTGWAAAAGLYQKQLSTLNATAAITPLNMNALKKSIDGAFTSMPVSRTQVVQLAESLTNLGVTGSKDLGSLITTMLKLQAATGEPLEGLTQGLVQLSRMMGNTSSSQIAGYANSLLTVSKNAGVSATGVLSFAQAIAPMARQAGIGQAAVLGISTAFSKAGADGYYAANTFNSIIGDITNLTQTGSPNLVKYASFIGLTADQFKKLPAQSQITGIFSAIAKGGPQAVDFVNQLGLGTRAISSIQAVAQSGGLAPEINQAVASQNGTGNLDKAAKAATGGASDAFEEFRNQITQIVTVLGEHFLPIITGVMHGMTQFAHVITQVITPFAPLIDVVSTLVAGFSALGGGALLAGGLLSKIVLAGFVGRSSPIAAFSGGVRNARTQRPNVWSQRAAATEQDRVAASYGAEGESYASGQRGMTVIQRGPYALGQRLGARQAASDVRRDSVNAARAEQSAAAASYGPMGTSYMAAPLGPRPGPGMVSRVAAIPLRGAAWAVRGQTDYVRTAGMPAAERPPGVIGWAGTQATRMKGFLTGGGSSEKEMKATQDVVAAEEKLATATAAAAKSANAGAAEQEKATVGVVTAAKDLMGALVKLEVATVDSATRITAAATRTALGSAVGGVGAAGAAESSLIGGVSTAGGMGIMRTLGSGLGRVAGAAFSPAGLLAMIAAPILIPKIAGLFDHKGPSVKDDENAYLNPVKALNDQLGITTSHLANFSLGLTSAAAALPNAPGNAKSLYDATTVTGADVSKYSNTKPTDKTLATLGKDYSYSDTSYYKSFTMKGSTKDRATAQALVSTYDLSDPRTVAAVKDNLLAAGFKGPDVQAIMRGATAKGAKPNYGVLGAAIQTTDAVNEGGHGNPTTAGKRIADAALTGIGNQYNANLGMHSARYSSAQQLQSLGQLLDPLIGQASQQKGGGGENAYVGEVARTLATVTGGQAKDFYRSDGNAYYLKTKEQGLAGIADLLSKNATGKQLLTNAGVKPGSNITPEQLQSILDSSAAAPSSAIPSSLKGMFGSAVSQGSAFQQVSFGGQSADLGLTQKAVEDVSSSAASLSGSYGKASTQLQKLADVTGGTAGDVLAAAAAWSRQLAGFRTQTESREGQLGSSKQQMVADQAVAMAPGASQASQDAYKADVTDYENRKESYRQYMISVYQQAQQFGTNMVRAQEDENTQVARANRDFQRQQLQSQQDYNLSRYRAERDYAIQNTQAAQTSAQTIYNPYQRIQAQYTTDAGTLEQNVVSQNSVLDRQTKELKELNSMGLSKEAIQTLNLASTDQAQQLDLLYVQAQQDPNIITQLNASTAKRLSLTKSLTQSDFNLSFQQSNQNFTKGLNDASKDYETAKERAVQSQNIALGDMATDYQKMIKRSAQDLQTSMTEVYGDFATVYGKTLSEINGKIAQYAPQLAKNLKSQLGGAQATVNQILGVEQVGTIGLNSKNQPGSYGASGAWTPYKGYITPSEAANLQPVYSPITGHAAGGLSTRAHVANFSEGNKAEAIVPLTTALGTTFMAGFVQQVAAAVSAGRGKAYAGRAMGDGGGTVVQRAILDQSTQFTGPIQVSANNVDELMAELQAKARLTKLSRPTASTAGLP